MLSKMLIYNYKQKDIIETMANAGNIQRTYVAKML